MFTSTTANTHTHTRPPRHYHLIQKPTPKLFAVMRNGHEVIRGLSRDCTAQVESGDLEAFKATYDILKKWEGIHAKMEDGMEGVAKGFFAVLNEKFDGVADKEGLTAAHDVSAHAFCMV